ncbi:hypothetical protein D3C81_1917580 [compost metagenome]
MMKYWAEAPTRMKMQANGRLSHRNEASVSTMFMTLKATTGMERNTSTLRRESSGRSCSTCL